MCVGLKCVANCENGKCQRQYRPQLITHNNILSNSKVALFTYIGWKLFSSPFSMNRTRRSSPARSLCSVTMTLHRPIQILIFKSSVIQREPLTTHASGARWQTRRCFIAVSFYLICINSLNAIECLPQIPTQTWDTRGMVNTQKRLSASYCKRSRLSIVKTIWRMLRYAFIHRWQSIHRMELNYFPNLRSIEMNVDQIVIEKEENSLEVAKISRIQMINLMSL